MILFGFQWPWMVSLQRDQGHGFAHFCGGSIIEDDIVLTAAHCIQDKQASEVKAVFGTEDLSLIGPHRTERNVSKIIVHPSYISKQSYYDVAILILDQKLDFNDGISSICLPSEATSRHRVDQFARLTGWGSTKPGGPASQILQHANMMIFATNHCNATRSVTKNHVTKSDSKLVPNLFHSPVFCAGLHFNKESRL